MDRATGKLKRLSDGLSVASFMQKKESRNRNKCFRCGKIGHIARDCKQVFDDDVQFNESDSNKSNVNLSQIDEKQEDMDIGWN